MAFTETAVDVDGNRYRAQIWLADVDGSSPPRPFTTGPGSSARPRWSPDGRRLAFVWHPDDDDDSTDERIHELRRAELTAPGDARVVASWPEAIEELAWSPDGSRLAFSARLRDEAHYGPRHTRSRPPRRVRRLFYRLDSEGWVSDRVRQLFVVAADGSSPPRAVTEGPFQVEGLSWSPDGGSLAFSSSRHDTWDLDLASDLFLTGVADPDETPRAPQRVTETRWAHFSPSWSPDGHRLAFLTAGDPRSEPRHSQLAVLDLATGHWDVLTRGLDRQCGPYPGLREPVWDGDVVWFRVEDGGNTHLYRSDPLGPVVGGDREVGGFDVAGDTVVFCASTPTSTAELFVLDLATGQERQLTTAGTAFREAVELVAPVPFVATAADGNQVQAWVMAPVGAQPQVPPQGEVLIHLGSSNFLERYKTYEAHAQEWRQQFDKLESVDLRYDRQIIVNPDIPGTTKQAVLSPAATRAAMSAGVKPAALIHREVVHHVLTLPQNIPATAQTKAAAKPVAAGTSKQIVQTTPAKQVLAHNSGIKVVAAQAATIKRTTGKPGTGKSAAKKKVVRAAHRKPALKKAKAKVVARNSNVSPKSAPPVAEGAKKKPSPAIHKAPQDSVSGNP